MTKFVVLHALEGDIVCRNVKETDELITLEIDGIILEDIPKSEVSDYV